MPLPDAIQTVLVTGATGFVGRNLVGALVRAPEFAGVAVRVFVRRPPPAPLLPPGVEVVVGAFDQEEALRRAVAGAGAVVHLAAKMVANGTPGGFRAINVDGARRLFEAAVAAGCRHFIHMSSTSVYGTPRSARLRTESDPTEPVTPYGRSKLEAEQALLQAGAGGCVLNILRAAGIFGAGTEKEIPLLRKIQRQRRSVELAGALLYNPIHVRDVVQAILELLKRPAPHRTLFNLGGADVIRLDDYHALLAQTLGTERRRYTLPRVVAVPAAALVALVRPNPVLPELARGAVLNFGCDASRFRAAYPFPMASLEESVAEYVRWARSAGHLS